MHSLSFKPKAIHSFNFLQFPMCKVYYLHNKKDDIFNILVPFQFRKSFHSMLSILLIKEANEI